MSHKINGRCELNNSSLLFDRALKVIPGGVNSPVRAFKALAMDPIYMNRGLGCKIFDVDGCEYTDYCASWGPLILGHSDLDVIESVAETAKLGLTFGTCTQLELELAEMIVNSVKCIEKVRLVNSGTEAVMSAIRLARGFTGRDKILKFDGCYHGHADYLLVSSGSGLLTNSISTSAGVPSAVTSDVIVCRYNDMKSVNATFAKYGNCIAAVIIEPIAGNMGLVLPNEEFLNSLRTITNKYSSLLIFDEVISGFRCNYGAYADKIDIMPDLITLGKIIGGGMPLAAFGGRADIMNFLAPDGSVYQAGTLSGNPVASSAGLTTLKKLYTMNYSQNELFSKNIAFEINNFANQNKLPVFLNEFKGLFTLYFGISSQPHNLDEVKECNTGKFAEYYKLMLENGIYLSPSQFEVNFISFSHSEKDIFYLIDRMKHSVNKVYRA